MVGQAQLQPPLPSCMPRDRPGRALRVACGADWAPRLLSPSQHTEPWLQSDESHERRRVVQSILLFLQHVVDSKELTVSLPTARRLREEGRTGRPSQGGHREPWGTLPPCRARLPAAF